MLRGALLLALPLLLSACRGPLTVEARTPASISICYDYLLLLEQAAADVATAHCAQSGLVPIISMRSRCGFGGSLELLTYECRPMPRPQ